MSASKNRWQRLYEKIGPLRYQSSEGDCVPTTLLNGLSVLLERPLHPTLLKLVWSLSVDQRTTGWVCCDALSSLLTKWFERAHQDKYETLSKLRYTSRIVEGAEVHLGPNNLLDQCLRKQGIACISIGEESNHYVLILGFENEQYLGFNCLWDGKRTLQRLENLASYKGLVNITWTREELEEVITEPQKVGWRWMHLLAPN
jgi:hypothetical protein